LLLLVISCDVMKSHDKINDLVYIVQCDTMAPLSALMVEDKELTVCMPLNFNILAYVAKIYLKKQ